MKKVRRRTVGSIKFQQHWVPMHQKRSIDFLVKLTNGHTFRGKTCTNKYFLLVTLSPSFYKRMGFGTQQKSFFVRSTRTLWIYQVKSIDESTLYLLNVASLIRKRQHVNLGYLTHSSKRQRTYQGPSNCWDLPKLQMAKHISLGIGLVMCTSKVSHGFREAVN